MPVLTLSSESRQPKACTPLQRQHLFYSCSVEQQIQRLTEEYVSMVNFTLQISTTMLSRGEVWSMTDAEPIRTVEFACIF